MSTDDRASEMPPVPRPAVGRSSSPRRAPKPPRGHHLLDPHTSARRCLAVAPPGSRRGIPLVGLYPVATTTASGRDGPDVRPLSRRPSPLHPRRRARAGPPISLGSAPERLQAANLIGAHPCSPRPRDGVARAPRRLGRLPPAGPPPTTARSALPALAPIAPIRTRGRRRVTRHEIRSRGPAAPALWLHEIRAHLVAPPVERWTPVRARSGRHYADHVVMATTSAARCVRLRRWLWPGHGMVTTPLSAAAVSHRVSAATERGISSLQSKYLAVPQVTCSKPGGVVHATISHSSRCASPRRLAVGTDGHADDDDQRCAPDPLDDRPAEGIRFSRCRPPCVATVSHGSPTVDQRVVPRPTRCRRSQPPAREQPQR